MGELKLDLGCGKNKQPGYVGVDSIAFDGVDKVVNLCAVDPLWLEENELYRKGKLAGEPASHERFLKWPWEDNSVDHIYCSHFIEHLDVHERVHFVNELYRVLKPKAQAQIITPHWASCRAYGDLTHKWPPVCEMWFYYLSKDWRDVNAPHNNVNMYVCDFEVTWGNSMGQSLLPRNEEYRAYAMQNYKEAITDLIATFIKK